VANCWAAYARPTDMAKHQLHRREPLSGGQPSKGLTRDVAVIHSEFTDYLRARRYAEATIERYRRHLVRIADWLHQHKHRGTLAELTRRMVPRLLAPECYPVAAR
jgi:hypothetical protein